MKRSLTSILLLIMMMFPLIAPAKVGAAGWITPGGGQDRQSRVDEHLAPVLQVRWETGLGLPVQGAPAVADGVAYVGTAGNFRVAGSLFAISLADGKVLWEYRPEVAPGSFPESFPSGATVSGDQVIASGLRGTIYALDRKTGSLIWKYVASEEIRAQPLLTGDKVIAALANGHLIALRAATGERLWEVAGEGEQPSTLTLWGDTIVAPFLGGRVIGFSITDGREVWRADTPGFYQNGTYGVLSAKNVILAPRGDSVGGIYALDASGQLVWRYRYPGDNHWEAVAVGDNRIYAPNQGSVVALDAGVGSKLWEYRTPRVTVKKTTFAPIMLTPVVGRNTLYVGSYYLVDGPSEIFALSSETGKLRWQSQVPGKITSPLAYSDGVLVFGTSNFSLVAMSPVRVTVDGRSVVFDDLSPMIVDGRTLIPLRAVFGALGAQFDWNDESRTVTATRGDIVIRLTVDSTEALVNGRVELLDVPARVVNDRVLVPLRFAAQALGAAVNWNSGELTAEIRTR